MGMDWGRGCCARFLELCPAASAAGSLGTISDGVLGDPGYSHDGIRVLWQPGRGAAQDLSGGQRLALGHAHPVLRAQLLRGRLRRHGVSEWGPAG